MFNFSHFTNLGFEAGLFAHPYSYITLTCNEIFTADNITHLYWDDNKSLYFEKIYCSKAQEAMQINPCDYLSDEDGYEMTIAFEKKSGQLDYEKMQPLLSQLQILNPAVFHADSNSIGRDGTRYTFCVGKGCFRSSYSWWNVETPKDWQKMEQLVLDLKAVSTDFEIQKTERYELTFSRTLEIDGWLEFINKKDL